MDPKIITHISLEERRCLSLTYCRSLKELSRLTIKELEQESSWFKTLTTEQQLLAKTTVHLGIKSLNCWLKNDVCVKDALLRSFGKRPVNILHSLRLEHLLQICKAASKVVLSKAPVLCPHNQAGFRNLISAFNTKVMFCTSEAYIESSHVYRKSLENNIVESIIAQRSTDDIYAKLRKFSWKETAPCTAVVGKLNTSYATTRIEQRIHDYFRVNGVNLLTTVHGETFVMLISGFDEPSTLLDSVKQYFENETLIYGPVQQSFRNLEYATHCALAGYLCSKAWIKANSIVDAQDLIPERVILGDKKARDFAIEQWYKPLKNIDTKLMDTTEAYLECAFSLEATAKEIAVHSNTVRYRLDQVGKVINLDLNNLRDIYTLKIAITAGRLAERKINYASADVSRTLVN